MLLERNLGEPSWWLSWREEGFAYLCRSQPPCEWRDTLRPVLPTPGLLEDTRLPACPPVQWPVGTRRLQSPAPSSPTLRTKACFHLPSLSSFMISQSRLQSDVHKLSNAAQGKRS